MKKNIIIGVLIVAVGVLLYFLLSGGKDHDSHKDEHTQAVANNDTLKVHDVQYRKIIDSLSIDNYRLDSANKSLKQGQSLTRRQLDLKTAEVKSLAKEVQHNNKDTGYQAARIDSLVDEVENYSFLLAQYESYADSINTVMDSLKINDAAIVKEKDKRLAELQVSYDQLYRLYDNLFKDYTSARKSIKREKLKTRIAALLALVAGGAAIMK